MQANRVSHSKCDTPSGDCAIVQQPTERSVCGMRNFSDSNGFLQIGTQDAEMEYVYIAGCCFLTSELMLRWF